MSSVTTTELRKVAALSDLPEEHLLWILEKSEYQEFEDGAVLRKYKEPINEMYFLLEGGISFYMDVNGRQVHYFDFENDTSSGGVSGLLPYSRMKTSPGYSYALGKVKLLLLDKKYFPELERLNPDLIQRLIGYMTERARAFATVQLQHEKSKCAGKTFGRYCT